MFCGFMHKDVFVAFQDVTKEKKNKNNSTASFFSSIFRATEQRTLCEWKQLNEMK